MIDQSATIVDAVTLSDTVDLKRFQENKKLTDWIYVGATGDVTVVDQAGNTILFKGAPVGTFLWVKARRVNNTGTAATNMLAGYVS